MHAADTASRNDPRRASCGKYTGRVPKNVRTDDDPWSRQTKLKARMPAKIETGLATGVASTMMATVIGKCGCWRQRGGVVMWKARPLRARLLLTKP